MKRFFVFLALTLVCLSGCSDTTMAMNASLTDIRDEIAGQVAKDDAVMLNSDYIYLAYGLDEADCSESAAFMVSRGTFPEEYILIRTSSADASDRVAQQLQLYLDNILAQSRSYEPETYSKLKDCTVYSSNGYVCMFLSAEHKTAQDTFLSHMKEYETGTQPVFTNPPVVTPEPVVETKEEVPVVKEVLSYGLVPESSRAEDSAFDGVIFIGNSVAGNLAEYVTKQRMTENPNCMGKAVLYTAPRFSYRTAVWGKGTGEPFPTYNGKAYEVEDAVEITGATKVYLSMGFNDIANYPHDELSVTVDYVAQLVSEIREKSPDVSIHILSLTPRIAIHDHVGVYNNDRIRALNKELLDWATENECYYIDCFSPLAGEDGTLLPEAYREYGDTDGIHLNDIGCEIWLDYLYTHTTP